MLTAPGRGRITYESIKFPLFDDDESVYATCGISLNTTERAGERLQLAAAARCDLLMDCQMPELDGYEATRERAGWSARAGDRYDRKFDARCARSVSRRGHGRLPHQTTADHDAERWARTMAQTCRTAASLGLTVKVLIVDDDAFSRMVMAKAVQHLGHECIEADGGGRGWELFGRDRPDVVISDWMMPDVDGLELCRRIRQEEGAIYASFIIVTGLDDEEHALEGMLAGADDYLTKPLNSDSLRMRLIAADRLNRLHRRLAEHQVELELRNEEYSRIARIDPLTGLGNRLRMQEDLAVLDANVHRYGGTYCIALFDVDFFKKYNDAYGHLAGDRALASVATVIAGELRGGDAAYRFGGEEFVCVFPSLPQKNLFSVLERIRQAVQELEIPHTGNTPPGVITISAGGSWPASVGSVSTTGPLQEADEALYAAKEDGRNRVVCASLPVDGPAFGLCR